MGFQAALNVLLFASLQHSSRATALRPAHQRLSLSGPAQVTGLAVSPHHPYVFSCGLDKMVKCWDMEYNKVSSARLWPLDVSCVLRNCVSVLMR